MAGINDLTKDAVVGILKGIVGESVYGKMVYFTS